MPKKNLTNLGKALNNKHNKKPVNNPEHAIFSYETHADPNLKFKNIQSALHLDPVADLL